MLSQAKAKRHSTIEEAVGIARDMDAAGVILTHFSQRYPKLVLAGSDNAVGDRPAVVMAFDCMRMRVRDMHKFALMRPALEELYSQQEEE
jgi:ribonuclease Z